MAQWSVVEDPRPVRSKSNHPSHPHNLRKTDMRDKYSNGWWRCACCRVEFNSRKSLGSITEELEADPTLAYRCEQCSYDVCSLCFKGYLHPFHHHRLKKANVVLVYPETEGQWRCDACQKVFTELTAPASHHCPLCEIDICDKCFNGTWKHVLHTVSRYHTLKPTDPRLTYRKYLNWFCDVCEREFTSTNSETFFNCSVCQYDICSDCFHGEKHHLHQHPLSLVSKVTHGGDVCSNCSKYILESHYRKCRDPDCCFSLCGLCYLSPPKYHPYHRDHPLELCNADVVYPQSAGLWHCDNCTKNDPHGEQKALPPSWPMYHCDVCDYDLCTSCYKSGLEQPLSHTATVMSSSYRTPYDAKRTLSSGYHTDTNQDTNEMSNTQYPYSSTHKKLSSGGSMEEEASYYHQPTGQNPRHNGHYAPVSPVREESLSFALNNGVSTPPSVKSYYAGVGGESSRYGGSLYGPNSAATDAVCVLCRTYKATKYFCHGKSVLTCTAQPVVCERCAGDVITTQKPCPACRRLPDGVSDIPF